MKLQDQYRYAMIAALTRVPNIPKEIVGDDEKIAAWAKRCKLDIRPEHPLYIIKIPALSTENYTYSNALTSATGYHKKGIFTMTYYANIHDKRHPNWNDVLNSCPDQWVKEGVGLWPNMQTVQRRDDHTLEIEVWIYRKPPLISREGLSGLNKKNFMALYDKGADYWNEPHQRRNAWLLIEREYYRRFDKWSTGYQKFLDIKTVHKNIMTLSKETLRHADKTVSLRELKELHKDMSSNPQKYIIYQWIDE